MHFELETAIYKTRIVCLENEALNKNIEVLKKELLETKERIGTATPSSPKQPDIVDKIFQIFCLCPRTLTPWFDPT